MHENHPVDLLCCFRSRAPSSPRASITGRPVCWQRGAGRLVGSMAIPELTEGMCSLGTKDENTLLCC